MSSPTSPSPRPQVAERKLYGRIAKVGAIWSFVRASGGQLIAIPTVMIMARLLSPEEFGIAATAAFFSMLTSRISKLGLNAALVRVKDLHEEHKASVLLLNLAVGVLMYLALRLSAPAIAAFYHSPETGEILPVVALNFLVVPFGSVSAALISRQMRFRAGAASQWASGITYSTTGIALAWNGFSFWSIVYAQLAANIALTATRLSLGRWRPRLGFSTRALGEVLPFGAGIYVKRLLDYSSQHLDSLVVGRVLGMTALGFYDKARGTMSRLLTRFTLAPDVSFRIFALIQEDPERLRRAYGKVILSMSLVGYPLFATLIVVAPQFIVVAFGDQWVPATLPFQILCAAGALRLLNTYASSIIQATGLIWSEVWRKMLYATLIVVGTLILSRRGLVGAAVAVLGATLVITVLMQHLVRQIAGLRWRDLLAPQMPGFLCGIGLTVTLTTTASQMRTFFSVDPAPWQFLGIQVTTAALFFTAFVLFAPFTAVRELAHEVVSDFAPGLARFVSFRQPGNSNLALPGNPRR